MGARNLPVRDDGSIAAAMTNDRVSFRPTMIGVFAIIVAAGLLLTLLMPLLNNNRVPPYASHCGAKMRQIALAALTYSSYSNDQLPVGIDTHTRHTAFTHLLPYLEAGLVYDCFDLSLHTDKNTACTSIKVPLFICPSGYGRPADVWASPGGGEYYGSNYVMCFGSFGLSPPSKQGLGCFLLDRPAPLGAIADGYSNTALLSEVVMRGNPEPAGVWAYGDAGTSAYTHSQLPNSGKHVRAATDGNWRDAFAVANSNHPNGVNVAFADGSVRFIDDTIDPVVWSAIGTAAGQEPSDSHAIRFNKSKTGAR